MAEYLDVDVSLSHQYPPICRRFLVRRTQTTFADLHRAIQDACGWLDYHLYRFDEPTSDGVVGVAQSPVMLDESFDDTPGADEVPLARWAGDQTPRALRYTYDFGDDWHHDVILRSIVRSDERFFRRLLGGARRFPPEDCGGLYGFERILHFLETGEDLNDDPYVDLAEWLGDWTPDEDMGAVAKRFDAVRKPRSRR